MPRTPKSTRLRRTTRALLAVSALVGSLTLAAVGVALARTLTLRAVKGTVVNQKQMSKTEGIAVNAKGRAVYHLSGETPKHPECTQANQCFSFWFPVTVKSAKTKPAVSKGITGKITLWHRDGFFQVVVGNHPLYTFVGDTKKNDATGEGIVSFGGTWHVLTAKTSSPAPAMSPSTSPPTVFPY